MTNVHGGRAVVEIREIATEDTYDLRMRVLRAGTPSNVVTFAEDALPGVVHIGGFVGGVLTGTSTWIPKAPPFRPSAHAIQLRGMAVDATSQGTGVGRAILREGFRRAMEAGAELVWANARDSALGFYQREGMQVVGDGFLTTDTQLPHHVVLLPFA